MWSKKFLAFINLFVLSLAYDIDVKYVDVVLKGEYRAFYDDHKVSPCTNVIIIGVGTGMNTEDYDTLATKIVSNSEAVVIIADTNPGSITKLEANDFSNFVNSIMEDLGTEC